MSTTKPRVLIEDWLPVAELGIESRRERAAVSALPALSSLHVWWARRPLVASAAVVLAGLLPAWTQDLAEAFPESVQLRDEAAYRRWLLHLSEFGETRLWPGGHMTQRLPVAIESRTHIPIDRLSGMRFPRSDVDLLHTVLDRTWGGLPLVCDPTAGGGSIPWTAARLGLPVFANDLNGVAASALRAGVEIPARRGDLWSQTLRSGVAN